MSRPYQKPAKRRPIITMSCLGFNYEQMKRIYFNTSRELPYRGSSSERIIMCCKTRKWLCIFAYKTRVNLCSLISHKMIDKNPCTKCWWLLSYHKMICFFDNTYCHIWTLLDNSNKERNQQKISVENDQNGKFKYRWIKAATWKCVMQVDIVPTATVWFEQFLTIVWWKHISIL